MKKIIQLLLFSVFLFASCIEENMDGCPATRTLVFKHHAMYDPDESFDRWVGNDVQFHVFQNNVLKMTETIPYERIKDGRPYSYTKRYDGEIDIVAWAVPSGSSTNLPAFAIDDSFNDKYVWHNMGATGVNATEYDAFPIDLYLGTDSVKNDVITQESTHTIRMINCACIVSVTITDRANVMSAYNDRYVLATGAMDRMSLRYTGFGNEAVVRENVEGENTSYQTGVFGILPSADNQTLSFTLYGDTEPLAIIDTDLKAMPGERIDLVIDLGLSVVITVDNSWDIYPVVQWM